MTLKLGDSITISFTCDDPITGQVSDADAVPTVTVYQDINDTALLTLTATKRTALTGHYRVTIPFTAGNGFTAGSTVNVIVTATVSGVSQKGVVVVGMLESKRVADLNDITAGAAMTLSPAYDAAKTAAPETGGNIAAIKTKTDNLPEDPADESLILAAIGTRADQTRVNALPTLTEIEASIILAKEATLSTITSILLRDIALNGENTTITGQVYSTTGKLTSATITTYASAANLEAGTPIMATYSLTAEYDTAGDLTLYQMVKS